ncbi:uncharacterized protein [Anabrus simplex]|uniref:uncharacterized protein n=1 Tax=Anabrus simplex TaxID=316456 RepID=UPI0035A2B724
MDLVTKIKEEPAWLEGTGNASLENIEHETQIITLKKEAKSELTKPGPAEDCSFEPSEDTKEEIFIEEHTVDQLVPYIKEETSKMVRVKQTLPRCYKPLDLRFSLQQQQQQHQQQEEKEEMLPTPPPMQSFPQVQTLLDLSCGSLQQRQQHYQE